jgi:hypothetical protein
MLAQATTRNIYTRGVRSRAATGSNPQAAFLVDARFERSARTALTI